MFRLLIIVLVYLAVIHAQNYGRRILLPEGKPAKPGQFPFLGRLHYMTDQFICGASIISPRVMISAAHCIRTMKPSYVYAVVGTVNRINGGKIYTFERLIVHEEYNSTTHIHDISLLKTESAIQFSELVKPVKIVGWKLPIDSKFTAVGWGETKPIDVPLGTKLRSTSAPEIVLYMSMKNLNMGTCIQKWKPDPIFPATQICTDLKPATGACIGDSGGPLVYRGHLAGIDSQVKDIKVGNTLKACGLGPDVYTKLSAYLHWIQINAENNS